MAELGNVRRVYLTTAASGGTYTWLTGEQTNSFNRTSEAIEVSDKSTIWQQFIAGKRGATASVTVFIDDTNEQQQKVLKALHGGTTVYCFIGKVTTSSTTTTPSAGDLFEAIVTSISDTNDNGAVASRAIELTVTGEPTHYPTLK